MSLFEEPNVSKILPNDTNLKYNEPTSKHEADLLGLLSGCTNLSIEVFLNILYSNYMIINRLEFNILLKKLSTGNKFNFDNKKMVYDQLMECIAVKHKVVI